MTCLERFKIRSLCASVVNSSSDHRVYFANPSVLRRIQKFQKEGSKALWSATFISTIYWVKNSDSLCIQKLSQTKKKILQKLNNISVVSWCMWTGTICKWRISENGKDIKQYLHHKTIRNTKKPKFQTERNDGQATSTHMKKVLFCVCNPLFLLHVWMKGPTVLIFFVHKHDACRLNILTNTIQPSR